MSKENIQVLIFVIIVVISFFFLSSFLEKQLPEGTDCYPDDLQGKSIYCD